MNQRPAIDECSVAVQFSKDAVKLQFLRQFRQGTGFCRTVECGDDTIGVCGNAQRVDMCHLIPSLQTLYHIASESHEKQTN